MISNSPNIIPQVSLTSYHNINLGEYPRDIPQNVTDEEITLGDLHGNTLKLIYFLIQTGVLKLDKRAEDYSTIATIYQKNPRDIKGMDIALFNNILNRATIKPCAIRLLGGELAGDGINIYFALLLIKKIVTTHPGCLKIMLSNHSARFLSNQSIKQTTTLDPSIPEVQSLTNMKELIDRNLVEESRVKDLIKYYKPCLRLFDYAINDTTTPKKIFVYNHAAVGIETIQAFALHYLIEYKDNTVENFAKTIDAINIHFQTDLHFKNLKAFINESKYAVSVQDVSANLPFTRLLWNRVSHDEDLKPTNTSPDRILELEPPSKAFEIMFIHGHEERISESILEPARSYDTRMLNLYNDLGKKSLQGDYHYQHAVGLKAASLLTKNEELKDKLDCVNEIAATRNAMQASIEQANKSHHAQEALEVQTSLKSFNSAIKDEIKNKTSVQIIFTKVLDANGINLKMISGKIDALEWGFEMKVNHLSKLLSDENSFSKELRNKIEEVLMLMAKKIHKAASRAFSPDVIVKNLQAFEESALKQLLNYIATKQVEKQLNLQSSFPFFKNLNPLGFSDVTKLNAAIKVLEKVLLPKSKVVFDHNEVLALKDNRLGKIIEYLIESKQLPNDLVDVIQNTSYFYLKI